MTRARVLPVGLRRLPPAALLVAALASACGSSSSSYDGIEYVSPEAVGWSSEKLEQARQFAPQSGYAAVMAAYDGKVFFSWGDVTRNFRVHSIRKPFQSALYGIHVARGEIDLDETVEALGIDDIPPSLTAEEKQATVRELLQSRSGIYHEAAAETAEMAALRPERGSHPHGEFFYYNNWDFNVAGVVLMQKTGLDVIEAFRDEIAEPIGMQDFDASLCGYAYEPVKSEHPATQFRMSARDMLRFGVLYQKGGSWLGRQVVPTAWIAESTATYSTYDAGSGTGYGYMWATIPAGSPMAELMGGTGYFHTGVGVHVLIVLPELKLVIVERLDTDGEWVDPGETGMQLGLMILQARI